MQHNPPPQSDPDRTLPLVDGGTAEDGHDTTLPDPQSRMTGTFRGEESTPGQVAQDPLPDDRYRIMRTLGEGGMGRVYLVYDSDLKREVALKVIRAERSALLRERFLEEAQVLGQLEHPNIVPIHDLAYIGSGRMYCTMRYVRGYSLQEVIRALRDGEAEATRTYSLTRLMQIFLQVTQAASYAHAKGVVHRDLKPANVMLGEHGEVQVLDWGLAKVLDPRVVVTDSHLHNTREGQILGTPAYMAPEQIGCTNVDTRADVYALGVILYELLTLRLPITGASPRETLTALLTQKPVPPRELVTDRDVPSQLEEVCMRALEKDPADRQRNAREIATAVQGWLEAEADRTRRHELAEEKAAQGRKLLQAYHELQLELARLESAVERERKQFKSWQSVDEKASLYEAEDRTMAARRKLTETASDVVAVLTEALGFERENRTALELLADYYWDRFQDAEARQHADEVDFFGTLVAKYHGGKYRRELTGDGSLALRSEPPGAEVFLHRLEEEKLALQPVLVKSLGRTPLAPVPLPMGSYLVTLRKEGYAEVKYPVCISRNRDWSGSVKLYTEDDVGAGFRYIPAGPFIEGGDPQGWSVPRREPFVDDFFIADHPVTLAEYIEFLEDLAKDDAEAAIRRSPRRTPDGGAYLKLAGEGRFVLPIEEVDEVQLHPRAPVFGVSWYDAVAYCEWRSRRDGRVYRLPTATEWEKAARGVDGRWFPWGNRFDASLCNIRESRPDRPALAMVEEFATDVSVYGVHGMSGNIRDWTSTESIEGEGEQQRVYRVIRGGAWYGGRVSARCADRFWFEPPHVYFFVGFRLARSAEG